MPLHTAELHHWFQFGGRLLGAIRNDQATHGKHPFPDGALVTTSPVEKIEGDLAWTTTGTVYKLVNEMKSDLPPA